MPRAWTWLLMQRRRYCLTRKAGNDPLRQHHKFLTRKSLYHKNHFRLAKEDTQTCFSKTRQSKLVCCVSLNFSCQCCQTEEPQLSGSLVSKKIKENSSCSCLRLVVMWAIVWRCLEISRGWKASGSSTTRLWLMFTGRVPSRCTKRRKALFWQDWTLHKTYVTQTLSSRVSNWSSTRMHTRCRLTLIFKSRKKHRKAS